MDTLYNLLGALPHDDSEGLRTAFRRAVKGAHPDLRPGDPDAALKFRQIIRANEILGDAEQRAAYDHLLELARLEQRSTSEHAIAARIYKLASGVIALSGASVATVAGYLLFMHMSAASLASANDIDVTMNALSEIAAVGPAGSTDTTDKSGPPAKRETIIPGAATGLSTAMPQTDTESIPAAHVGPAPGPTASEARSLRAQGIFAYRNGDLNGTIADLDRATQFDPKFLAAAYIDHGTIFYRLRKFDRVFAGMPAAKRIEKASRSKSARKPRFEQATIATSVTPLSQRRTVAQDPLREERALRP